MHSPNHSLPAANAAPGSDAPESACLTLRLSDEAATNALGAALAGTLAPGMVVWLDGDLGAGKTTLVRALLRALGHAGPVKSPTYTLVELYSVSSLYLYHFDFYRFNDPEEFDDAGLGEYFRKDAVCLVEWPDKATRDAAMKKMMEDPRMDPSTPGNPPMPFDGKRMIFGGFEQVVEVRA